MEQERIQTGSFAHPFTVLQWGREGVTIFRIDNHRSFLSRNLRSRGEACMLNCDYNYPARLHLRGMMLGIFLSSGLGGDKRQLGQKLLKVRTQNDDAAPRPARRQRPVVDQLVKHGAA